MKVTSAIFPSIYDMAFNFVIKRIFVNMSHVWRVLRQPISPAVMTDYRKAWHSDRDNVVESRTAAA